MKKKVLVFPCGSEIGLEIHRALAWSKYVELFGASSVSSNHGKYVYKNYIEGLPFVQDATFISKFNALIDEHKVDFVFPAHDDVIAEISKNQDRLACTFIGSPAKTCQVCRSKCRTYKEFKTIIRTPTVYENPQQVLSLPVFLKPNIGQGSKGTYLARSHEEIEFYLKRDPSLLVLEYLPGNEFTIDCFTDFQGRLRFVGARERVRTQNGISVQTRPAYNRVFNLLAEKINQTLKFRGAWFFQVKEDVNGELALMEIAPRIAGGMGLYRNLGINFALLAIFDAMNVEIEVLDNGYYLEMDRALTNRFRIPLKYTHVYVDLDDCLIFETKVNTMLVAFLYQCLNKGIKCHLVTRSKEPLKILSEYRLEGLFDTIVSIDAETPKSLFITEKNAILIDDSFAERMEVYRSLNIPIFDLDAVESLMDWRL